MDNSTPIRLVAAVMIWALLMAAMVLLAQLVSPELAQLTKVTFIVLAIIGIIVVGSRWNWGRSSTVAAEDPLSGARNRLSRVLHDMSDSELIRLRQRLASGDLDDDLLANLIDESDVSKAKRY